MGKLLIRQMPTGEIRLRITETEAYRGEEDTASHAHKGRTARAEVMNGVAGTLYVYLCYGIHIRYATSEDQERLWRLKVT